MTQVKLELVISEDKTDDLGVQLHQTRFVNKLLKISAILKPNGKWDVSVWDLQSNTRIARKQKISGERDIIEIFEAFSDILQFDIQNPHASCPECTCPQECDCQAPETGLMSNHCPIHNEEPEPYPDCPQHNMISDIL